jgi:hypothetical protein
VLHANPDKFNGTTALQGRGVEVLTSQAVLDGDAGDPQEAGGGVL